MNPMQNQQTPSISPQIVQTPSSPLTKRSHWSNPKRTGITALISAIISFFILPYLGIGAAVVGVIGIYYGVQQKSGAKVIGINILAIILGFSSFTLNTILNDKILNK